MKTRYLKEEYRGVIAWVTYIGQRGGVKEYAVTYYDGHEVDMDEFEVKKLYKEG